jgi:hypothetical protein
MRRAAAGRAASWTAVWRRWVLAVTPEDRKAALDMGRLWEVASGERMPRCMR